MRKTAAALAIVLVASLGMIVPSVAASVGDPKIVIIVGATHGATAGYRADADVAYAEAIKYTSNVVKVYSPNATWAKVKAAVAGASIVIYMGHGNGWPSPYTYDAKFTTKDGFGLNATAGNGDYNNVYYGEPYVSTLDLAPGAIVLLHHLCYAAGNSEPGSAEPTISVARQRADNYAAGFLKAGAAVVLADGHSGAEGYLRALFTTHQSIEQMWRTMPNANGNFVSFPSARTVGTTVHQDPISPISGFYRSLAVGTFGVTTDEVVSAGFGDTGVDPTNLVIPGNAAVSTDGAGLYVDPDTTPGPAASLPAGTRLRIVGETGQATAEGAPLVEVKGLDDAAISGFMLATDLAARDNSAPAVRGLDAGLPISPNGDGQGDRATIRARFTESVAWTLGVRDAAANLLFQTSGSGATLQASWDGVVNGHPVADGPYTVSVMGVDAWGNAPAQATRTLTVDTKPPVLTDLAPGADSVQWFSPNGDGVRDLVSVTGTATETGLLAARVLDADGALVKAWSVANGGGPTAVAWDGRNTAGAYARDGIYRVSLAPVDLAGNTGEASERTVSLIGALRSVATSTSLFFPQDLDKQAPATTLSFVLARPMTTTWTVRDAAGQTVATRLSEVALPAGTQTWRFDGRRSDGTMLPRGRYVSFVTATDGTQTASQSIWFDADAFRLSVSDTTPRRGQYITVTVTSAESLSKAPRVHIYQPGVPRWSVATRKIGTRTYRVTFRLKASGRTGAVALKVVGYDLSGAGQRTIRAFPLH